MFVLLSFLNFYSQPMKLFLSFLTAFTLFLPFTPSHPPIVEEVETPISDCYHDQSDLYWRIGTTYGSKKLASCGSDAQYNCHAFVMAKLEGTCAINWSSPQSTSYPCPSEHFGSTSGTHSRTYADWSNKAEYLQVPGVSGADIIYYDFPGGVTGEDHVAVRDNTQWGKFISKYGTDGPLVAHNPDGTWYQLRQFPIPIQESDKEYWVYLGTIGSGASSIQVNQSEVFNVKWKSGVTYNWSVIGSNGEVVSSSGNYVTVRGLSQGTFTLQLTAVSSTDTTTLTKTITVTAPPAPFTEITGHYFAFGNFNTLYFMNPVPSTSITAHAACNGSCDITWEKTSGTLNATISGSQVSFTMVNQGSIGFRITAYLSGTNTAVLTRNVSFSNEQGGGWMESTPGQGGFLSFNTKDIVKVVDLSTGHSVTYSQSEWIETESKKLASGFYAIRFYSNGKLVASKKILSKD